MTIHYRGTDRAAPARASGLHPVSLCFDRPDGRVEHRHFGDITAYLRENDLIVVNDTKVIPARLAAVKETGGGVDILLTEKIDERRWSCLVTGLKKGTSEARVSVGGTHVRAPRSASALDGRVPGRDRRRGLYGPQTAGCPFPTTSRGRKTAKGPTTYERYQTVYARKEGLSRPRPRASTSTRTCSRRIGDMGVGVVTITLHIGIGTFFLIKSEHVEGHEMHREYYSLSPEALEAVRKTKEAAAGSSRWARAR